MGAEMPRYRRENLSVLSDFLRLLKLFFAPDVPFMPDNLLQAVEHALIRLLAGSSTLLQLTSLRRNGLAGCCCERHRKNDNIHSCLDHIQWIPSIAVNQYSIHYGRANVQRRKTPTYITKIYAPDKTS